MNLQSLSARETLVAQLCVHCSPLSIEIAMVSLLLAFSFDGNFPHKARTN